MRSSDVIEELRASVKLGGLNTYKESMMSDEKKKRKLEELRINKEHECVWGRKRRSCS